MEIYVIIQKVLHFVSFAAGIQYFIIILSGDYDRMHSQH